jgi:hypothetical protein
MPYKGPESQVFRNNILNRRVSKKRRDSKDKGRKMGKKKNLRVIVQKYNKEIKPRNIALD